ncbi:MAG: hypothetical protein JSW39_04840 [Desulfobacterales bacterium]|nr:MAG: hypothetical protein JSW39_04840 [Desulfobacterales bacterium]
MSLKNRANAQAYVRYPVANIVFYNGVTVFHYLLGAIGIILGYRFSPAAWAFGALYLAFALLQMYLVMPLTVCPHCIYFRTADSLCPSGLNVIAQKIAQPGHPHDFGQRAKGWFCHNNLYIAALIIPIIAMLPALILNFSYLLLILLLAVVGLLLLRFLVIFTKTACVHCLAKNECPNAQSMGLSQT